jgi:hypothetical protein
LSALGLMLSSWEVEVGMNTLPSMFSLDCCGTYLYGNRGFLCFSRIPLFNWSFLGEITIVVTNLWKLTLLRVGLVLTGFGESNIAKQYSFIVWHRTVLLEECKTIQKELILVGFVLLQGLAQLSVPERLD